MTIAVTTPTGHVGSHLVRLLIRAGLRPRVLCRDPKRLTTDVREAVDAVPGDQRDAGYLREALADVAAVYWVHPDDWSLPDPNADAGRTAAGLAEAVRATGVRRVVLQSTVGAEKQHGAGFLDGLARAEQALDPLADAGVELLHLRCGYFMTNLLMNLDELRAGSISTAMPPEAPMAWVDPVDVAGVAAGRLLGPGWDGRAVQAVHGPADLSYADVARILSGATGRDITVRELTDDQVREQLHAAGMGDTQVEGIVGMTAGLRDGFTPEQARDVTSSTPATLAAWAYTTLREALDG